MGNIAIFGCGAVTAAGRGARALAEALAGNERRLSASARLQGRAYQSEVAGLVPDDVWQALRAENPGWAHASVFLLASEALKQAVAESGFVPGCAPPERVGLVLSTTKAEISALEDLIAGRPCHDLARRHISPVALAGDLAACHGARGPVRCVSVACVSGLAALQQAACLVASGAADIVLAAGVDVVSHFAMSGFSSLQSLDPEGCRPFDKRRRGLSLGEGAGAAVVARPGICQGRPRAFIGGWGFSNDANHLTGPSRDGQGLALAMSRALRMAEIAPGGIDYINAHGTGTVYNDAMESLALKTVFGQNVPPFSSTKGATGHTLGAAGLIEAIACLEAGRLGFMPGTAGLDCPDDVVPAGILSAPRRNARMRHVLKINAGFGGINAAIVLELNDHGR